MVMLLLLSFLPLSLCAIPKARIDDMMFEGNDHVKKDNPVIKEHDPKIITVDGIEGILYDLPEYEDAHLLDYQLAAMGGSPIISLLQMAKKQSEDKDKYIPLKEKSALLKKTLDDVISRLQTVRTRLDKGTGDIYYVDIEKSIQALKKLEHNFRPMIPSIEQLLSSVRQTMSIASPIIETDFLSVKRKPASKPTEMPIIATSEGSFLYTQEIEEGTTKPPSVVEVYKTPQKDDDDEKISYRKSKYTWKSSSFV